LLSGRPLGNLRKGTKGVHAGSGRRGLKECRTDAAQSPASGPSGKVPFREKRFLTALTGAFIGKKREVTVEERWMKLVKVDESEGRKSRQRSLTCARD